MTERIIEEANYIVSRKEEEDLEMMRKSVEHAEIAATVCGCRTCQHVLKVTENVFQSEIFRLYYPEEDTSHDSHSHMGMSEGGEYY